MIEKDYIDVGGTKPIMKFNLELSKVKKGFDKQHMPYDEPCARLDFLDECERLERESERKYGYIKVNEIKVFPKNLEKYGDVDRFELVEDKEETEFVIINGIRTAAIAGHTMSYKCKERGHGIAVYIPIREYEEMKAKKVTK